MQELGQFWDNLNARDHSRQKGEILGAYIPH